MYPKSEPELKKTHKVKFPLQINISNIVIFNILITLSRPCFFRTGIQTILEATFGNKVKDTGKNMNHKSKGCDGNDQIVAKCCNIDFVKALMKTAVIVDLNRRLSAQKIWVNSAPNFLTSRSTLTTLKYRTDSGVINFSSLAN